MDITYTWSFNPLDCAPVEDGLEKVIKVAHWRLAGSANGIITDVYGTVSFDSPDSNSCISFDTLTQETVESWVTSKLDVDSLKNSIKSSLEEKLSPKSITLSPPWLSVSI